MPVWTPLLVLALAAGAGSRSSGLAEDCERLTDEGRALEARPPCERLLAEARGSGDLATEVDALVALGGIAYWVNQYEEAMASFRAAVSAAHAVGNARYEGNALEGIGLVLDDLGRHEEAIADYQQVLAIRRATGDRKGEASALSNIAVANLGLSRYQDALRDSQAALALLREEGILRGQAIVLSNVATAYKNLGLYDKALEYYQRALSMDAEVRDPQNEAMVVDNVGSVLQTLGRGEEALVHHQEAVRRFHELGNRQAEGIALINMGSALANLGRSPEALARRREALAILREVGDREGEGRALSMAAADERQLGQLDEALGTGVLAAVALREVGSRDTEVAALSGLMSALRKLGRPAAGIFFGKLAVEAAQDVRERIRSLDPAARRSFLNLVEGTYRELADLLLTEGRLPEAQQVLALLKDQELGRMIPGPSTEPVGRPTLTSAEAELAQRMESASGRLERARATGASGPARQAAPSVPDPLAAAREEVRATLAEAAVELEAAAPGAAPAPEEERRLSAALRASGPRTVALFTLVAEDRVRILLVTSGSRVAREVAIPRAELARQVMALREVLEDPTRDPVPEGQALYRILVAPVAPDLRAAGARTLWWSLDGVLRYVPPSALHDGSHYLVERYRSAILTAATLAPRGGRPVGALSISAFGVSRPVEGFSALPGVDAEMRAIVRAPRSPRGALPGTLLLDEAFTRAALLRELERHRPIVHIATHFRFQPAAPGESVLLLGDGTQLTLAGLAAQGRIFQGTDILTLSGCETAISDAVDGREAEGFAALAIRQGARSVAASLWQVDDDSTRRLMTDFYRLRQRRPSLPKAEALRRAQLALLHGQGVSSPVAPRRSAVPAGGPEAGRRPYAHPYFWAPFVLFGEWR